MPAVYCTRIVIFTFTESSKNQQDKLTFFNEGYGLLGFLPQGVKIFAKNKGLHLLQGVKVSERRDRFYTGKL